MPKESKYFQSKLRPSLAQQKKLDELLSGPVFLQRLIAISKFSIKTADDASNFLDNNWCRLSPYMFEGTNRRSPKQLEKLILDIALSKSRGFALDFTSQCMLTPRDEVIFPIPGLGEIELAYPAELRIARTNMRHQGCFTLLTIGASYEIGITFLPITSIPINKSTTIQPRNNRIRESRQSGITNRKTNNVDESIVQATKYFSKIKPQVTARMSASDFLATFNNRVIALLNAQLKISKNFTTTRFGDLEGRAVSGGLPSLPRRH